MPEVDVERAVRTARSAADRLGFEIASTDTGPGVGAVALGAVRRLMREFEISTSPTGTCIKARRWPNAAF